MLPFRFVFPKTRVSTLLPYVYLISRFARVTFHVLRYSYVQRNHAEWTMPTQDLP